MPPWTPDRLHWLLLCSFPGFGSRTLQRLREGYDIQGVRACRVLREELRAMGVRQKTISRFFAYRDTTSPRELATTLDRDNIRLVLFEDEEYPPLLKEISDPPRALFMRGAPFPHTGPFVAAVGTRAMTTYGQKVARALGHDLARAGYTVVSGLALGIDGAVHEAVIENNGCAIAVLGCGLDENTIYPRMHLDLAHAIMEHGGVLVSEFPPHTFGLRHHFPLRNRIIAGLAQTTIVVEATEHSGSLITAHLALEENREVLAVPGPITSSQSKGTNRLIARGAAPYLTLEDLSSFERTSHPTLLQAPPPILTDTQKRILRSLFTPRRIDELARHSGLSIPLLSQELCTLELAGIIEHLPDTTITKTSLAGIPND